MLEKKKQNLELWLFPNNGLSESPLKWELATISEKEGSANLP